MGSPETTLQRLVRKRIERARSKPEVSKSDVVVSNPADLQLHASLRLLVKDIGALLDKHFSGWAWVVQPDQRNQIINIWNLHLNKEWGYTIRTVEIHNDPKRRLAITAGREILERFGFRPGPLNAIARAQLSTMKRYNDGQIQPVDAWDRMTKQQREQQRIREEADKLESVIHGLQNE